MVKSKNHTFIFPLLFASFVFLSYLNKYFGYSLLIVIIIIYCLSFFTKNQLKFLKHADAFVLHLVFALFLVFSSLYSVHKDTAIKTSLFTLAGIIPGLYFYEFGTVKLYKKIIKAFSIFSFVFSFVTVISLILPNVYLNYIVPLLSNDLQDTAIHFFSRNTSSGLTNQTGINAWFSVIGLAIALTDYFINKKIKSFLLIFFYFIAILFTGKRAHFLFSIISAGIIYFKINKHKITKLLYFPLFLLIGLIISFYFFPELILERFIYRFMPNKEVDISANRFFLWTHALNLFFKKPLLGWGYGYFSRISENFFTIPINVHNVYIQLLCEVGLIGFLLFFISTLGIIKYSLKNLNINNYESILSVFIQIFFLLYCFTGNPLTDIFIYCVYIFFVCSFYKLEKNYGEVKCTF